MGVKFLYQGMVAWLDRLTGNNANSILHNCTIGLYTNAHVPAKSDVVPISNPVTVVYTEATWPGYVRQTVPSWTAAAIVGVQGQTVGDAVLIPGQVAVTNTAVGLLIFDSSTGLLLAAADFVIPASVPPVGLVVQVTLLDDDL